jgi:hypothetical protein
MKPGLLLLAVVASLEFTFAAGAAQSWYVDSRASGAADGRSWDDAWLSFRQMDWDQLAPETPFSLQVGLHEWSGNNKGGTSNAPITIRLSGEPGRVGDVYLAGFHAAPRLDND